MIHTITDAKIACEIAFHIGRKQQCYKYNELKVSILLYLYVTYYYYYVYIFPLATKIFQLIFQEKYENLQAQLEGYQEKERKNKIYSQQSISDVSSSDTETSIKLNGQVMA